MFFSNGVSKRLLYMRRNGYMNGLVQYREEKMGFLNSGGFNIKGGALSMSVINWSLRLSSFNISININKETQNSSSKIEKLTRGEQAAKRAFAFKDNVEAMYHLSSMFK